MKKYSFILSVITWSLLSLIYTLQAATYSFDKINNRQGLSSDQVVDICQDKEGFIWIATNDGLNCYTGTDIITYRPLSNDNNSLTSSNIKALCSTKDNKLWVAVENGKIDILDRQSNTIEHLPYTPFGFNNSNTAVNDMLCDAHGNIWVASNRGLSLYSQQEKTFTDYRIKKDYNYITSIYESKEGEIYCAVWGAMLFKLNTGSNQFERVPIKGLGQFNTIRAFLKDEANNLWIASWGKGLYKASPNEQGEYMATHTPILNDNYPKDNSYQIVYDIAQDKSGDIWLGTDVGLGIIKQSKTHPLNIEWIKPGSGPNDFSSKDASKLMIDNAYNIWIGTESDGLSRFDTKTSKFTTYTSEGSSLGIGSNIFSSFWYYNKELYTGVQAHGFGKYDLKNKTFTSYKELPEFSGLKDFSNVLNTIEQCQVIDERYLLMRTRYRGIFKYDLKERKRHHLPLSGIKGITNQFLYEKDRIWVGKNGGLLLFTYDPYADDKIFPYTQHAFTIDPNSPSTPNTPSNSNISGFLRDRDGQLWISYQDGGLDKVHESRDPEDIVFEAVTTKGGKQLSPLPIQTMYEDQRGNIWLGTSGEGLWLFNKRTSSLIDFNEHLGLENKIVSGIIEDDNNNLWVSTNKGIFSFNILSTQPSYVINYDAEDGLQSNIFKKNAVCKSPNGSLLFGGYHGFNYFDPQDKQHNTFIPPLAFTRFEINRKPVYINYTKGEKLIIDHKSTSFLIAFAALSYSRSQNNQYRYMIEGYDQEWIKSNKGSNYAIYGKLPSGEYTFKIMGSNNNGVWNPTPLEVGIIIKRSPFLSILAFIIYFILLGSLVWAYIYYSQRNFKLKQAYKEEQNERLREEKINQFKLKFFTNISHELLTPLSIISNAVEQYVSNKPKEEAALAIVQRNANRLSRLINQLLDFRKVESSNRNLKVSQNDIDLHVSSLKDNFDALCAQKDISFVVEGQVGNKIFFDSDKLDKILHNILSNAFKHTPQNGTITLHYHTYLENNTEWLKMSISDTGKGIPEEFLNQIFERFYRIDDRKHEPGAGIGLAFTKSLISSHKGSIKATNNEIGGALFTFRFPVSAWSYTGDEIASEEDMAESVEYSFADEMDEIKIPIRDKRENNSELPKILLVEDNHDMRTIMRNFLSKYFEIYESGNGVEGLETLNNVDIELVVSDIMMPEMDGLTFCRRLKNNINTSHIPVILTTAKRSEKNYIEGYEANADSYITKPVNLQLLMVRIINLLEQRKRLHELFSKEKSPDIKKLNINNLDQNLLNKINEYIEENINQSDLTVVNLAKHVSISTSVLYRKVKSFTGLSPNEYIRSQRLNHSSELLRQGLSPSEVTYECGFSDPSYFGACFKKQFGVTPKKYVESL